MLSLPSVIEACRELGFEGKNLIAMQGPFSEEMNRAMLRQYDCRYLVTKDSGKAGGFPEKIQAAISCGAVPVIIGRPSGDTGISPGACRRMLAEKFGFTYRPHVTLLGIGMGSRETLTIQGKETVDVYKRQICHCPFSNCGKAVPDTPDLVNRGIIPGFGSDGAAHGGLSPVSYTHLDVYKRQALQEQIPGMPEDELKNRKNGRKQEPHRRSHSFCHRYGDPECTQDQFHSGLKAGTFLLCWC